VFQTDQGNFVMPSEEKAMLARRISLFMPADLDCVLFGVTRGESMEAAVKLCRGFTGRSGIVTVDGGCYGESGFALSLSHRPGKEQFGSLIPDVTVVPFGDLDAARAALSRKTACFVMEPVQAENNCRSAPRDYYADIRSLCDEHGAKLIFDETQSGFGRTGKKFFFEHLDVVPDILLVGEAITAGMFPMTAMVFTSELKRFFDIHPLIHLCTFGGHDLGCHAAMAALDEYDRLAPWERAASLGAELMKRLHDLGGKHGGAFTVEGRGLLVSLKFTSPDRAQSLCRTCAEKGLLIRQGQVDPCCVLIRPSLLIDRSEIAVIIDIIDESLR